MSSCYFSVILFITINENNLCTYCNNSSLLLLGTLIWERLAPSGVKPQPRSQFCAFVAPSLGLKTSRYTSANSTLGSVSTTSTGGSSYTSGYSSGCSGSFDGHHRSRRLGHDGKSGNSAGGGGTITERDHTCPCHDYGPHTPSDEDDDHAIDPNRLRMLIQKNCVNNHQSGNLKASISKFSQLNLSHLGRYYSYSMLSNDSTESIVEDSLASTCDSLGSKLVKSQSIHGLKEKHNKLPDPDNRMALSRDIMSVPNFGDITDQDSVNSNAKQRLHFSNLGQTKLMNVLPRDTPDHADLDDDPGDLVTHSIHGRLAFRNEPNGRSTDTSISDNLMSFSCTESSVSSEANIYSESHYSGLGSFSNPNYVAYDSDKTGGLLSQDYWRKGALDLESARHKQFAEVLRTPPDSGIGLGVEMERRTHHDVTIKTLEDFVNLDSKKSQFRRPYQAVFPVVGGPSREIGNLGTNGSASISQRNESRDGNGGGSSGGGGGTARVTFGEASDTAPTSRPRVGGDRAGGSILTSARLNPFLRAEPVAELLGPEVMYIVGGKETGHLTLKRPLSVWKLNFPF